MYFLVDVENVKNAGLRGSDSLLPTDHVILFYSDSTPHLEARHLEDIRDSGCGFEVCKLLKVRKTPWISTSHPESASCSAADIRV